MTFTTANAWSISSVCPTRHHVRQVVICYLAQQQIPYQLEQNRIQLANRVLVLHRTHVLLQTDGKADRLLEYQKIRLSKLLSWLSAGQSLAA